MQRLNFMIVIWVVLYSAFPSCGAAATDLTEDEVISLRMRCGPNALYLYLKSHGLTPDFETLNHQLTMTTKGVSFLELKMVANEFGLPSEISKISTDELFNCNLPLIAYFPKSYNTEGTGHFVLVYELKKEGPRRGIWFIDPTTGKEVRYRWEKLPSKWDGYVLQTKSEPWNVASFQVPLLIAMWLGFGWFFRRAWLGRVRTPIPGKALVVALILTQSCYGFGDERLENSNCRTPEFDAANSLYLLLHAHEFEVDHSELVNRFKSVSKNAAPPSLADIASVGRQFLNMQVTRIDPGSFTTLPLPAITHQNDLRSNGGTFNVVLSYPNNGQGMATIVSGTTGVLTEISVDDFRRDFSGLVLTVTKQQTDWLKVLAVNLLVLALIIYSRSKRPVSEVPIETGGSLK